MKDCYIYLKDYIPVVANDFYKSISAYKQSKLLFETELGDLIIED